MLDKATRYIAKNSSETTVVSRNPDKLANDIDGIALKLDWLASRDKTIETISKLPDFDLLISWIHDEAIWLVEHLENKVKDDGRSIRIHGCASRDQQILNKRNPVHPRKVNRQTVILGWINERQGQRWLLDKEISAAVIEAVDHRERRSIIVGTIEGELSLDL